MSCLAVDPTANCFEETTPFPNPAAVGSGGGIAISTSGAMFWTDPGDHIIYRASNNGGERSVCYKAPEHSVSVPIDIVVDDVGGYIYWEDQGSSSIKRGRIDCSGTPESVVPASNGSSISGIALDLNP